MSESRLRPATPEYVSFPLDTLPEHVQPFVSTVAAATQTDPAFTALPLLSLLGAMVGTARAVAVLPGWLVHPAIWTCVIGRSASGKTPALAAVSRMLDPLVDDADRVNREERRRWLEAVQAHKRDSAARGTMPPPEPPQIRLRVDDITLAALAFVLWQNPRGVWAVADEMAGWLSPLARGSRAMVDRGKWIKFHEAGTLEIDRRSGEPRRITVRKAMIGLTGGVQPEVLRTVLTREAVASGLFARLLMAYPPPCLSKRATEGIPDESTDDLTELLRGLRNIEYVMRGGRVLSGRNKIEPAGLERFLEYDSSNRERAHIAGDDEAAVTCKLVPYAVRFAHLRHLCRHAGGADGADLGTPISTADVDAGIRLAEWFRSERRRVLESLAQPERDQRAFRLAEWVRSRGGSVTVRDLQRMDDERYPTADAAASQLAELAAAGYGVWREERAPNGRAVTRFVLAPDTRHSPTLLPGSDEDLDASLPDTSLPPPDTVPDESCEKAEMQGAGEEVSGSVGCRNEENEPAPPKPAPLQFEITYVKKPRPPIYIPFHRAKEGE